VHSHLGLKLTQKLSVESEKVPKTVQFFSSNSEVLFFPDKYSNPIILVPNIPNEIKYIIFPKSNSNNDILVNCVDISSRELLRSWMIRMITEKPQINFVHQIDCRVGSATNFKYEFMNQLNSWILLNFESNNQELMNVK
jgi:nephrocystin-4